MDVYEGGSLLLGGVRPARGAMWAGGPLGLAPASGLDPGAALVRGDPDGLADLGRALTAGGEAVSTTIGEIERLLADLAWSGSSARRLLESWSAAGRRASSFADRCDRAGQAVGTLAVELAAAQRAAAAASATVVDAHGGLSGLAEPAHAAALHAADTARRTCLRTLDALLCRLPAPTPGGSAAPDRVAGAVSAAALLRSVGTLPQGYAGLADGQAARLTAKASALARDWHGGSTPAARRSAAAALRPAGRAARAARETAAAARATADAYPAARVAPVLARSFGATVPALARTPLGHVPVVGAGLTAAGDALAIGHGGGAASTILGSVASMGAGEMTFGAVGGGLVAAGAVGAAPVLLAGAASMGAAYGADKGVSYLVDHGPGVAHRVARAGRTVARAGRGLWHRAFG